MGNAACFARKARPVLAAALILSGWSTAAVAVDCADPLTLKPHYGDFAFRQTRKLASVPRPLVSEGVARIDKGKVVWSVRKPFAVETVITPSGMTQAVNGGPAKAAGGGTVDPFLRSSGLFQLLTGDYKALSRYYAISTSKGAAAWRVSLTPRDKGMARFVSAIEVSGCTAPADVLIRQVNGDLMTIAWLNGG